MKQKKRSRLLEKYLEAQKAGKEVYFDADEVDEILESLECSDDYSHYEAILALGLRLHPGSTNLRFRQCKFLVYNEKYNEALDLIESISDTEDLELDLLRLECYCALDQYHKVVSYLETHLDDKEALVEVFEYVAPMLNDMDMNEEASDFIQRGLKLFPNNLILKDEKCANLEALGDIEGAIKVCNELIDENPFSEEYWSALGRLYSIAGEFEQAIEAFDFALTCNGSNMDLKMLQGYCLYMNGSYKKAEEIYSELLTSNDKLDLRVIPFLAECHFKQNNFKESYILLEKYLNKIDPDEEVEFNIYFYYLCSALSLKKKKEEIAPVLSKAIELYPNNAQLLLIQTILCIDEGDEEGADRLLSNISKNGYFLPMFEKKETMEDFIFNFEVEEEDDFELSRKEIFEIAKIVAQLMTKNALDVLLKYLLKMREIKPDFRNNNLKIAICYYLKSDSENFNKYYSLLSEEEIEKFIELKENTMLKEGNTLKEGLNQYQNLIEDFLKDKNHKN